MPRRSYPLSSIFAGRLTVTVVTGLEWSHFATVRDWAARQEELEIGRALWFRSPSMIDAAMAPELALEIVQSFGW
ncbi:MAG TPA: hypothetical protein ENJ30_01955, partial [Desulfobulbaceae bacterium]|nr:hypothetical protein [Desulfobulbaceae bacterium]